MILADLTPAEIKRRLTESGLRIRTGPFVTNVHSMLPLVGEGVQLHYANHPIEADDGFADFHVRITEARWLRRQVLFQFDENKPFAPLPADQAFPMLEWGMNWCISSHCHNYLIVHAAVLERRGRALILPAPPGSGKSTLCAGLACRGWRLLSDELTLIDPASDRILPVPRPISLKNASIEAITRFEPGVVIGRRVHDTQKGTVAHMRPAIDSVRRADEPAAPGWIVLPRFVAGSAPRLTPLSKAKAFMQLADNAFNYHLHGREGFDLIGRIIDASDCYEFSYGDLADAEHVFRQLAERAA